MCLKRLVKEYHRTKTLWHNCKRCALKQICGRKTSDQVRAKLNYSAITRGHIIPIVRHSGGSIIL